MLLNTFSSQLKYVFLGNFTQFSFPSLCVLPEGNIKMVEAEDGEIVYNDKLSFSMLILNYALKTDNDIVKIDFVHSM